MKPTQQAVRNLSLSPVSDTDALTEAIVSVGDFATGEGSAYKNSSRLGTIARLADSVARIRMLGSAATDLAWLAAGRIDAVLMHSNKPWDVGAGIALARNAGAVVSHHDGSNYSLAGSDVLAASPGIHEALVNILGKQT